jgi:hypothetical protein
VPEFDHNKTKYSLRGMHEKVQCTECHVKPVFTDVGKNCVDCHSNKDVHRHQLGQNCEQCHTVQGWNIAVQQVKDHLNRFPLLGAHAAVQCEACHKQAATGIFYGLSTECQSCHLTDWQKTNNPPHASAGPAFAASNCQNCHTNFDSWLGATFNHSVTGFILDGAHTTLACTQCHINNNYNLQGISNSDCGNSGCHLSTWQQTNNPPHANAPQAFPLAGCSNCHNTTSWNTTTFNHASTGFPLTNAHAAVTCAQCHINNNYNLTTAPTDCGNAACHLTDWNKTNNPVHATAGSTFAAANCSNCHDTIAWTDLTSFNHSVTGFTLTGMHVSPTPTPCVSCHVNNNYTLTIQPTDCGNSSCHLKDWNSTQRLGGNVPNHVTAGFPMAQCSTCHSTTTWANSTFNHAGTGFPLTNAHANVQCEQCHTNNNYNLTTAPTDCGNAGCHLTDWNKTNNPVHSTAGSAFAVANCSNCHDTITWTDLTSFNHSVTGFTLTGMHVSPTPTPCASCHVNNNYTLTIQPNDCGNAGCHLTTYQQTNNPVHNAQSFPIAQCSTCHNTTSWTSSSFNHSSTGFVLDGLHTSVACASCHVNNNYNLTGISNSICGNAGCHQTDYNGTNDPVHSAAGTTFLASNCSNCHSTAAAFTTTSWTHTSTGWALTGNHQMTPAGAATNCNQCHVGNNYGLSVTDCYNSGCHTTDWNSTRTLGGTVPNHVALGYPTSLCSTCHDTISWADGTFNHASTGWALTGAHLTTTCNLCHVSNNYSLTSANTACYGCHTAEWISTQTLGGSVPNHVTAGYPTTCDSCHTTTNWLGATFNHTYFPIPHHGSVCADCHQVSTDYSQFTCINCHTTTAHQQTQTDKQHQGVGGYTYGPTTCYNCHKNGGG